MAGFSLPCIRHFNLIISRSFQTVNFRYIGNVAATSPVRRRIGSSTRCFASAAGVRPEAVMNVFDRKAKRTQRNISALNKDYALYEYLREEVGWRMADRICDVKRKFDVAVDVGCGRGYIARDVHEDMVGLLYQCDMAENVLQQSDVSPEVPTIKVHCDEEFFPFKLSSLDLAISSLSLHWVNDLPGVFRQIFGALKGDGCFMGAIYGSDTLYELRVSLQLAEMEREGGFSPHVSPFTTPPDLGNLLQRTGFNMLTIDTDEIVVNYPSMFELMADLKGMGENNCSWSRKPMLHRDTMLAAAAIYKEMYAHKDKEGVPATFQIINFIGWKPDPSQPKLAQRGSGQVSMKDIDKIDELVKTMDGIKDSAASSGGKWDITIDKLQDDLDRLKPDDDKKE